ASLLQFGAGARQLWAAAQPGPATGLVTRTSCGRRVACRRADGPPGAASLRTLAVKVLQLDVLVPQRDSGAGTAVAAPGGFALRLLTRLDQSLADAGAEGQLEVDPGGDRRRRSVCSRRDVGLRRPHHLQHQAGVQRVAGVDVLGEAVRVDERRVRCDVAL